MSLMRSAFLLRLSVFLLMICMPIFGHATPSCSEALSYDQESFQNMNPIVFKWLTLVSRSKKEDIETFLKNKNQTKKIIGIGDTFKVGKDEATVLAYLGAGGNGAVYLVKLKSRGERLFAAKTLDTESNYFAHIEYHDNDKRSRRADRLPQIVRKDLANLTIVIEYKEGIPVSEIETYYTQLGFTEKQMNSIVKRFESLTFSDNGSNNVIYSPKLDKFYLIDPN